MGRLDTEENTFFLLVIQTCTDMHHADLRCATKHTGWGVNNVLFCTIGWFQVKKNVEVDP